MNVCGTPYYCAPEVHRCESFNPYLADIWSLGILLFVLLTGSWPFDGEDYDEIKQNAVEGKISFADVYLSENALDLIKKMVHQDPNQRIYLDTIFQHPFFTEISNTVPLNKTNIDDNNNNNNNSDVNDSPEESNNFDDPLEYETFPCIGNLSLEEEEEEALEDELIFCSKSQNDNQFLFESQSSIESGFEETFLNESYNSPRLSDFIESYHDHKKTLSTPSNQETN
eukprot:TRINITY_DN619_c0_g1_i1.p1 TRINITY_DN619_c0_g1~~TRINITY_DN619_c0_g1_i1.p1  ORF type:complete len:226 (-),score=69.88 TRINITY_DN619_c0_g1_i1:223-900(-)